MKRMRGMQLRRALRGAAGIKMGLALGVSRVLTLGIGIYPEPFLRFAQLSVMH